MCSGQFDHCNDRVKILPQEADKYMHVYAWYVHSCTVNALNAAGKATKQGLVLFSMVHSYVLEGTPTKHQPYPQSQFS